MKKLARVRDFYYRLKDKKFPVILIIDSHNGIITIEQSKKDDDHEIPMNSIKISLSSIPELAERLLHIYKRRVNGEEIESKDL